MDNLITLFNSIHEINKELKLEAMRLPQIVVIGAQSSGKSSVLESIVGYDFVPKGVGTVTRCPLRLQLINADLSNDSNTNDEFAATFNHKNQILTNFGQITQEIVSETKKRCGTINNFISSQEIVLEVRGPQFPTLTFVDLPGFVKVAQPDQPPDLEAKIEALVDKYISSENSIILAISPGNIDIATSEAVKVANRHDPGGKRTFHVLTKLDIMDEGTSAEDILSNPPGQMMHSLGVIGVVNRSQHGVQTKMTINEQRKKEDNFFAEAYPALCKEQGTKYLIETLVKILKTSLQRFIPQFRQELYDKINNLTEKLDRLDPKDKLEIVLDAINRFYKLYDQTLSGQRTIYSSERIEGGALISSHLYMDFPKLMDEIQIREIGDEAVKISVINTAGIKDFNYSFQAAFQLLIRRDIRQFHGPSNSCVDKVGTILSEFIRGVLNEVNLEEYPVLRNKIQTESEEEVKHRCKQVSQMINDYIECEWFDITFTNPYEDLLSELRNMPVIPEGTPKPQQKVINLQNLRDMILKLGLNHNIMIYYPFLYMGLIICGLGNRFLDAFNNTKKDPLKFVMDVIDLRIGLEGRKVEIFNHVSENMKDFVEGFQKTLSLKTTTSEDKEKLVENQVIIIKHMLESYFNMVRRNVKNYVPKVVQTFLLKEIADDFRKRMEKTIMKGGDSNTPNYSQLIVDDQNIMKVRAIKHDLEKLENMQKKFEQTLNR